MLSSWHILSAPRDNRRPEVLREVLRPVTDTTITVMMMDTVDMMTVATVATVMAMVTVVIIRLALVDHREDPLREDLRRDLLVVAMDHRPWTMDMVLRVAMDLVVVAGDLRLPDGIA